MKAKQLPNSGVEFFVFHWLNQLAALSVWCERNHGAKMEKHLQTAIVNFSNLFFRIYLFYFAQLKCQRALIPWLVSQLGSCLSVAHTDLVFPFEQNKQFLYFFLYFFFKVPFPTTFRHGADPLTTVWITRLYTLRFHTNLLESRLKVVILACDGC